MSKIVKSEKDILALAETPKGMRKGVQVLHSVSYRRKEKQENGREVLTERSDKNKKISRRLHQIHKYQNNKYAFEMSSEKQK